MMTRREEPTATGGCYLEPKANVADAERVGILQALNLSLVTQPHQTPRLGLHPPGGNTRDAQPGGRHHPEVWHRARNQEGLQAREGLDTGIAWVRAHRHHRKRDRRQGRASGVT